MRRITPALLTAYVSLCGSALAASIPPSDTSKTALDSGDQAVLKEHEGVLEIEARGISLGMLSEALAAKASVEVRLADPSLASCSINAERQHAASLRDAIERLLEGFSYALYPTNSGALALTIVATCPAPRLSQVRHAITRGPTARANDEAPEPDAPQSLDEFEPLAVQEPTHDGEAASPSEQDQQAYRDAVLSRALKALHSPHQHLKEEAIDSLAGVRSPEVTQLLIDAASGKLGLTMEARTNAVAGLRQNATEPGFVDPAAVGALEQLAKDANPAVSSIAQNALKDLHQRAILSSAAPAP